MFEKKPNPLKSTFWTSLILFKTQIIDVKKYQSKKKKYT